MTNDANNPMVPAGVTLPTEAQLKAVAAMREGDREAERSGKSEFDNVSTSQTIDKNSSAYQMAKKLAISHKVVRVCERHDEARAGAASDDGSPNLFLSYVTAERMAEASAMSFLKALTTLVEQNPSDAANIGAGAAAGIQEQLQQRQADPRGTLRSGTAQSGATSPESVKGGGGAHVRG